MILTTHSTIYYIRRFSLELKITQWFKSWTVFEILVAGLWELAYGWFQVTAKKFHTFVTFKGQSTSLLKSTKIHFPEGLSSQSNETTNTISSTRSPDLMVLFTGITMAAAISSLKVNSFLLVPVCLIVKVRIHCCKIIAKLSEKCHLSF